MELEMAVPPAPKRLSLLVLDELSATQIFPLGSTARPQGSARPPPVSPEEEEMGEPGVVPAELNSLMAPRVMLSVTQISPRASMATPMGSSRPPPVSPEGAEEMGEPVELNSLRLWPTLFTTQAWPSASNAM